METDKTPDITQTESRDMNEPDRVRLLLDATPLACRLMKRVDGGYYELLECNEEAVKLFKFKSKQDFMERYFETYPEYQPDGSKSIDKGQRLFEEAYENGKIVTEFVFQTADGELIPSEVTLVRLEYGNEYIVAGYTRDMREQKRMMETIGNRNKLLNAGNLAVQTLLTTDDDTDIGKVLLESLEIVGRTVSGDRVQIWRNEIIDETLHFVHAYQWLSEIGKQKVSVPIGLHFPYSVTPEWEGLFLSGECINGPISELSKAEQLFLDSYEIKTFLAIPLFIKGDFWGFLSVDDCVSERVFTDMEIIVLCAVGQMLVSAINRNAQIIEIRESHDRVRVLLEKMPFACHLWNNNYEMIDCNDENARLFEVDDKNKLMSHFSDFAPEYQPDGRRSSEIALAYVQKAFTEGKCVCDEFIHLTSSGTPIPTEIILVRIPFEKGYAVAAYLRDMREQKQMMSDIKKRDSMLDTMNSVASVLLAAENEENGEISLVKGMQLIGEHLEADCVQLWSNETIGDELHYVLKYKWLSDAGRATPPLEVGMAVPYSERWKDLFFRGECINGPTANMSPEDRQLLISLGIISTIIIPLFYRGRFWGLFCVDDYVKERYYTEGEIGILHSAALMLVNSMNRVLQAAQIREAHGRTQLLLDTTPLAVHLWDRNHNLFDCNEETVRLFRTKDKQDYISRFSELSPEYQPDGLLSSEQAILNLKRAFKDGKNAFEWLHRASDGTLIPSEITLVRVAYEDEFAIAGYVRDMREHKEMTRVIEQKSNLLDSVNKAANILLQSEINEFENNLQICMGMIGKAVSADRLCIWRNSVKEGKLYCSLVDEWITDERLRTSKDISTDVPYEGNIPTFERVLTKGDCINALACDLLPEEHARLSMHGIKSVFAAPVFVHDVFWGFVGCDNCHEERVFSDEVATTLRSGSLLITNALLRNEMTMNLQKAAVDLKTALVDTQKANDAKSDFLANMSHEMRTPLNAIIGLTWLSLENDKLNEETQSNLEKAHNAGTTLLGIVNDILDISKIESGKLDLVSNEYNYASLINDTVTQNILRIGEKPIEFKLNIEKDMYAYMHGDELRLKQIMNNLLSNAIKYTDKGEVELTTYCVREDDTIWLTLQVRDTGRGIKPEDLGKLFDDYTQLDTKANRKLEGTGLGLPITKRLCELMDGSVSVKSEFGTGSIFTAKVKQMFVSDATLDAEVVSNLNNFRYSDGRRNKDKALTRIRLPYAHILVVDDNLTNLDVARGLMKPYGMQIDCVDSGQKAIDAMSLEEGKYDAVFMDQMMPGMDGTEAAQHIREISSDYAKKIPIIALTANAVVGNEEFFLSKGFQAFLSKPIDIGRLDAVIRQWLYNAEKERLHVDITPLEKKPLEKKHADYKTILHDKKVDGIDLMKGAERFGGDEQSYINILRTYATNTRNLLDTIKVIDRDNLHDYEITIHSIKGASFNICADKIGKMAQVLERAAKLRDINFLKQFAPPFITDALEFIAGLDALLSSLNEDDQKPKKDKPDKKTLYKLYLACDSFDMNEVYEIMDEIDAYQYESDNGLVDWIKQNVQMVNFSEIVEKLSAEGYLNE